MQRKSPPPQQASCKRRLQVDALSLRRPPRASPPPLHWRGDPTARPGYDQDDGHLMLLGSVVRNLDPPSNSAADSEPQGSKCACGKREKGPAESDEGGPDLDLSGLPTRLRGRDDGNIPSSANELKDAVGLPPVDNDRQTHIRPECQPGVDVLAVLRLPRASGGRSWCCGRCFPQARRRPQRPRWADIIEAEGSRGMTSSISSRRPVAAARHRAGPR